MRITLTPLNAGELDYGPFDCDRFWFTHMKEFRFSDNNGSTTLLKLPQESGPYCVVVSDMCTPASRPPTSGIDTSTSQRPPSADSSSEPSSR